MNQKMEGESTQSYNSPSASHSEDDRMFSGQVRIYPLGWVAVVLWSTTELSGFSAQTHLTVDKRGFTLEDC